MVTTGTRSDESTGDRTNRGMVRTSNGEQAAHYVQRLIFDGELKPGSRVPQDDIARALGISRIPLREALIALEREGWVTLEMHRGAFVNALDEQTVRDHYKLFGLVYAFTVKQALERSGDAWVERLAVIAQEIASADNPADAAPQLLQFHSTMIDGARSNRIKVVLRAMSTIVPDDFFSFVPGAVDIERTGIPAILQALQRGDGDGAADEYLKMVDQLSDEVVRVLRDRGLFAVDGAERGT